MTEVISHHRSIALTSSMLSLELSDVEVEPRVDDEADRVDLVDFSGSVIFASDDQ